MQYCFLQHQTLLSLPDTSTTECHFSFGPATSFFLELLVIALCSLPVAYWTFTDLSGLSSGVISFFLFRLFMGFLQQEYWSGLPFPPLSERFTMTRLFWVTHMAWLISLLSYASPFARTRMLSMKLYICVLCIYIKLHTYITESLCMPEHNVAL